MWFVEKSFKSFQIYELVSVFEAPDFLQSHKDLPVAS